MYRTLRHLRHSPTRLLWFFIGATATACWIKYKEVQRWHTAWSHHCIRSSIQLPALPSTPDAQFSWIQRDITKVINNIPPAESWEGQLTQWKEEKEALFAFGQRAGDNVNSSSFLFLKRT